MLDPIADTMVWAAHPTANYGAEDRLHVASPAQPNGEFQTLLKFDFAAAKQQFDTVYGVGQWQAGAAFNLFFAGKDDPLYNDPVGQSSYIIDWFGNDGWAEGTGTVTAPGATGVTWGDIASLTAGFQPQALGGWSGQVDTGAQTGTTQIPHPGFQADLTAGAVASFRVRSYKEPPWIISETSVLPKSREWSDSAQRPTLQVIAGPVPEPTAATALLALTAAAARRRRR
jgi:MYXO-CTERM domain-containing protein